MTAPAIRSRLMPFARCNQCDWRPEQGKSFQAQAERHTNDEQHTTEAGWERGSDAKRDD